MSSEKLVTVGTSLYNKAPYLKDWAESLAKQTYLDKMFILVVEDCSTDNSLELLKKYVKEYHLPVKILKNKKNMGVVYATQRIYENLRTKYFAILDADDFYFSPERIERGVKFLETHNDYSCHISNYILSYSDGRKGTIRPYPPLQTRKITMKLIVPSGNFQSIKHLRHFLEIFLRQFCLKKF